MEKPEADPNFQINIRSEILYNYDKNTFPSDYVRSASTFISKSSDPNSFEKIPAFLHFRPLPANIAPAPKIDCSEGDCPRCSTCHAYLSPFVCVNSSQKSWRCPLCGHLNSTLKFTHFIDMTFSKLDRDELHNLVYDIIPPKSLQAIGGMSRVFCFVIEEDLLNTEIKYYDTTIAQIRAASECFKDGDLISLITYSGSVSLFDLKNKKATAFTEFEPEFMNKSIIYQRNGKENIENLFECLESVSNKHRNSPCRVYSALKWCAEIMGGYGGRIILMTSGRTTEAYDPSIFSLLRSKMLSLNVFKHSPNKEIESIALQTGGHCSVFGRTSMIRSLFTMKTGWDASTSLRLSSGVSISEVIGNCSVNENDCIVHPIIDQSMSITCLLSVNKRTNDDMIFQFAFRFTDDNGMRYIRIVNGRMKVAEFIPPQLDEASIALFILRKRAIDRFEKTFLSRCRMSRKFINPETTILPVLLHEGMEQDINIALMSSVERFAFSIIPTELIIHGRIFKALWTSSKLVVYPEPDEIRKKFFSSASEALGLVDEEIYSPKTDEEYKSLTGDVEEANIWYFRTLSIN